MACVLVASHESLIRRVLRNIIGEEDYEIVESTHCLGAADVYKVIHPDVVVLDMAIHGGGGLKAMEHIRKHDPNAKIIVLAMVGQKPTVVEACEKGANHYILKPFNTPERVEQVTKTLHCVLEGEYVPGHKQSFLGQS